MMAARYLPWTNSASERRRWPALLPPLLNLAMLGWVILSVAGQIQVQAQVQAEAQPLPLAAAGGLLRQADAHLKRGDYESAAESARQAAQAADSVAEVQQRAAELLYLSGRAAESLPLFDRALALVPENAAYNWQRGIALCSLGKFAAGGKQFQTHHDVNPDDVENSAWYFLCIAKTQGLEAARRSVIPSRGDGRQPMMSVLQMLQGKLSPAEVLQAAVDNTPPGPERTRAEFYAALYVGLYYDALDNAQSAEKFLKKSLDYGLDGYMAHTARVYLAHRFPPAHAEDSQPSK